MPRRIVVTPPRAPADPPSVCRPWLLLTVMLGALALTACSSRHSPPGAAQTAPAASDTASADEQDPCGLLDPKEAEAALGAPLATPPFRSSNGDPFSNGDECTYEDAHFRRIVVGVEWDGASAGWKMMGNLQSMVNQGPTKGMLHLADGSDLAGTWDEARVEGCCKFTALLGDQSVSVDVEDSTVGVPEAAKLADAALKRLQKPLSIDSKQTVAAAKDYEAAHRVKRRDPCSFLTRAEAEAIIGPLAADPKPSEGSCEYDAIVSPGRLPAQVVISVGWTSGYQELRENTSLRQGFLKGFTAGMPHGKDVAAALSGGALPASPYWEVAYSGATRAGGLGAVKNDVMIGVDAMGVPHEQTMKVLETAMSKL
jgi:hypothetical protein